ncbi:nucleotidyltransferase domain-containing protein [Micromonospora siamensis]|uniref:Nucleotidyltransferase domain-containing protein n=1 Tax=Micromonospora siamensis TaxID=299152 RepID=A0A1C5HRY1_9ACTN|nr:nucleotidyltransferase domain-containing protein [Micromonospora siamensis]SCG48764.1 Nucleotidyltransferase domain-containing protein [Micromonospora siamensis]
MIEDLPARFLARVDRLLPGYVRGFYVVGSAALGAWLPGVSDLDAVILTSRTATEEDLSRLRAVHEQMPAEPHLDGVYLDPALARRWPADRRPVPFVVDGRFITREPCGELTPVLWLTLRRYGIRVRGPEVGDLGVRVDQEQLRRYNLENLRDYWGGAAAALSAALARVPEDQVVDADRVAWFVLGPARLHHTLARSDVISKAAAGAYLGELFPEYADLARRAVRWRAGESERFTAGDLATAVRSVNAVVGDAWRRFGDDPVTKPS